MQNEKLIQNYIDRLAGELSKQEARDLDHALAENAELRRQCSLLDEVWTNSGNDTEQSAETPPLGGELRQLLGRESASSESEVIPLNFHDLEGLAAAGSGPGDPNLPEDPTGKIF